MTTAPVASPASRRVARALQEHGPSTVAQLADRLGMTPAGVRRHLDALVAAGQVSARSVRAAGPRGRGRPARSFTLTDAGRDSFETAYDDLAADALRFLADRAGTAAVADFARARTAPLAARLRVELAVARPEQRPEAIAAALTAAGYAASARRTSAGGAQICQHHCPVAHVAAEFPQLCDAETAVLSEVLGTHVQRLATIAHGDGVCTTHVPAGPGTAMTTSTTPTSTTPTSTTTTTRKRTSA